VERDGSVFISLDCVLAMVRCLGVDRDRGEVKSFFTAAAVFVCQL
jgi:hypothetical protein